MLSSLSPSHSCPNPPLSLPLPLQALDQQDSFTPSAGSPVSVASVGSLGPILVQPLSPQAPNKPNTWGQPMPSYTQPSPLTQTIATLRCGAGQWALNFFSGAGLSSTISLAGGLFSGPVALTATSAVVAGSCAGAGVVSCAIAFNAKRTLQTFKPGAFASSPVVVVAPAAPAATTDLSARPL